MTTPHMVALDDEVQQRRHGRPQKLFQGVAKSTFWLSFCGCWRCNGNRRIRKIKCPMLRQQLHTVLSL